MRFLPPAKGETLRGQQLMDRSYKHLIAIKNAFLVAMEMKLNIAVPGRGGDEQLSSELRGKQRIGNYMISILYFFSLF